MTRAAVYARVSTDDQAERQTMEAQLDACREYCRKKLVYGDIDLHFATPSGS